MKTNVFISTGRKLIEMFWESCEVKKFVVQLLEKYASSTDNDIDDITVELVRTKLLKNCK
ncbi:MAG: hypothetical protein ACO3UU_13670 [Minisyncoccia bacterium]